MPKAYIALGSNLSDPENQINLAFQALRKLAKTKLIKKSSLYLTPPVGYDNQPDFINAVAEVNTNLSPEDLMKSLLAIEQTFGRERLFANAPRVLDLDLLCYEDLVQQSEFLTLPHPRMHTRGFVLLPLSEIAPNLIIPQHGNVVKLAEAFQDQGIKKLSADKTNMTIFDKYPYIVIEGPIGSGKTTLARMLADKFSTQLLTEKAEENPFLSRFYQDAKRYALPTQLFFLFQRSGQISEVNQLDMFAKPITADFFLEKDPLFARLNLDEEEYALYHQIYQHLQLKSPKPDLVIYLQTPVDALAERIAERNISYESEIPQEYLKRIADAYSEFFHSYDASPILIVNNEKLNIIKDESALNLLVDRVSQIKGRREYFNPNFE